MTIRLFFFFLLPAEISIITLPLSNSFKRKKASHTYLLTCYMLKGIETLIFEPILFTVLMLNNYDIAFKNL